MGQNLPETLKGAIPDGGSDMVALSQVAPALPMSVPSVGPKNAKIAIVGESPGDEEVKQGVPFVGAAGKLLDGMLEEAGIKRSECYITNLLDEQPDPSALSSTARNNFGVLYEDVARKSPSSRLLTAVQRCHLELDAVRPHVILALGNEPLRWLTGQRGITDWRGSVLPGVPGGVAKVLPTYHPAAILRQWDWRPVSVFDYKKALAESAFPELKRRPRKVVVVESLDNALYELKRMQDAGTPVAFDIEVETQQISSIAFAQTPAWACTIPIFWGPVGSKWAPEEEHTLWEAIAELFRTTPMVGHNVHYDLTFLKMYDVYAHHLYMDTMVAFHVLYPELPKGLDFVASIMTDLPYWKGMRTTADEQEFYRYNGLDALATIECAQEIEQELKDA